MKTGEKRYSQILRAATETPWAILDVKFHAIAELIALRAAGQELTPAEVQARIGQGPSSREPRSAGTVAVLPLYGVLVPRADLMSEMSGATSLERWTQSFRAAVADPGVDAILLDVDSPGGSTDLVQEAADVVFGARGVKPVTAVANTDAASAAYWIASQADELVVTPSGSVGSIGVFAAHQDISAAMEKLGIDTTLIYAGKHKVELNPFEPLSEDARTAMQALVDEFYGKFVAAVARGRGVSEDAVRNGFGEGRMVPASDAVRLGMADRVGTFEETADQLVNPAPPAALGARRAAVHPGDFIYSTSNTGLPPGTTITVFDPKAAASGLSFADEAAGLRASADALVNRLASLAEVERGRLTTAKRDPLSACPEALRAAADQIDLVLAATDPSKPEADEREALLSAAAVFELTTPNI